MPSNVPSAPPVGETPSHISLKQECSDTERNKSDQFPEGGIAAWCTVIGAMLVQMCCFGYIISFGVYQDFYALEYLKGESSSSISWIGSANAFVLSVFSLVAGMLHDRGFFYPLIIGGALLESLSLFMLSLTQPGQYYQIFLAQGICLGIAQGLIYIPAYAVISHYFQRRRTLAMSLVACGDPIGSIIHTIMLNYLFNHPNIGFANGVRISAALVSTLLLFACLLMRTRLEPPKIHASYLSVGGRVIRDAPYCVMGIGLLFFHTGFYYPLFYFQLDSVMHVNSKTFSFYSLVLLNGGSLLGRLSAGFIAPRVGVPGLIITATAVCGILSFGMIGLSDIPTVVVLGTLYGYFSGIYIAMLTPIMAFLTSNFSELGIRMGMGITVIGIGALIGGPIAGALLTSQYKWWKPSLFSGLIGLTGCLLLTIMQLMLIWHRKRTSASV